LIILKKENEKRDRAGAPAAGAALAASPRGPGGARRGTAKRRPSRGHRQGRGGGIPVRPHLELAWQELTPEMLEGLPEVPRGRARLFVSLGSQDLFDETKIKRLIGTYGPVPESEVSDVRVFETHSFVEIPAGKEEGVVSSFADVLHNLRPIHVEAVRGPDAPKPRGRRGAPSSRRHTP
jgi:hypothetical protein